MAGGWELLKNITTDALVASGASIDTGTIPASKFLKISIHTNGSSTGGGGNNRISLRFNGDGADTNKYASLQTYGWQPSGNTSNGTIEDVVSQDEIMCMGYAGGDDQVAEVHITNPSQGEKLIWVQSLDEEVGNPSAFQAAAKWADNSQITSIQVVNKGSQNFGTGTTITVWGADDAGNQSPDPDLPNGALFEESDTGKIYMWDGTSAWNEVT